MSEGEICVTCRATPEDADKLFEKLAMDRRFRERVQANPARILRRYGIELSGPGVPSTAKLATKEEIQELRRSMRDKDDPLGRVSHGTWCFQLLCVVFKFGALPFIQRDALRNGAP